MLKESVAPKASKSHEALAVLTRGHTGRKVTIDLDYSLAKEWSTVRCRILLHMHPGAQCFLKMLRREQTLQGTLLTCFRGRLKNGNVHDWEDMGPPPAPFASDGRYNRAGCVVLYLADSQEGATREMTRNEEQSLVLQEYSLDFTDLRLADLAHPKLHSFLRAVFDIAESCRVVGRGGPDTFHFSQTVAALVKRAGFDGMVVPGVRGGLNLTYRNIVVFNPSNRWRVWSRRAEGFIAPG